MGTGGRPCASKDSRYIVSNDSYDGPDMLHVRGFQFDQIVKLFPVAKSVGIEAQPLFSMQIYDGTYRTIDKFSPQEQYDKQCQLCQAIFGYEVVKPSLKSAGYGFEFLRDNLYLDSLKQKNLDAWSWIKRFKTHRVFGSTV